MNTRIGATRAVLTSMLLYGCGGADVNINASFPPLGEVANNDFVATESFAFDLPVAGRSRLGVCAAERVEAKRGGREPNLVRP